MGYFLKAPKKDDLNALLLVWADDLQNVPDDRLEEVYRYAKEHKEHNYVLNSDDMIKAWRAIKARPAYWDKGKSKYALPEAKTIPRLNELIKEELQMACDILGRTMPKYNPKSKMQYFMLLIEYCKEIADGIKANELVKHVKDMQFELNCAHDHAAPFWRVNGNIFCTLCAYDAVISSFAQEISKKQTADDELPF